ncbi:M48 family metalloprotease [Archangium violaceum]|uniref:M48 family metalloprotease n=1 Tax=Archangium violaceum TaxID=83451 RepID=UPI00193BAB15|nr:M48 family metalloprotease [Archangium violaceum]QRK05316.1 M48 family metalloprotease [Archangium violaceum]
MRALLLSLLLAQAASEPPEKFPFSAELEPVYERVFDQVQQGQSEQARPGVEQLVREAPDNPRAWRLLGFLEMETQPKRAEEALRKALELGIDGHRRADVLATLASQSLDTPAQQKQARRWLLEALQLNPKEPRALYLSAVLYNTANEFDRARGYVDRLLELHPDMASAHALRAAILANQGEDEEAAEEVAAARAGGATAPFFEEIEGRSDDARMFRLAWQLPLGMVLLLGLSLGLLYLAGTLLSRVQVKRLASVDARLLRDEQTPQERRIDKLYNAVLWAGSLLFYVSVPMTLIITLATGGALLYGLFLLPRIPVKLILIALVIGLGGLWAIVRGLFVSGPKEGGGRVLTEAEAPRLFAALAEVAEVARAKKVDKVYLDADAGIGVREAGGTWRVLLGGGERILHLGYAALRGMSVTELKAILAHEYGHFSHGETRLNPVIGRIQTSVLHTLQGMAELGQMTYANPVYWFLRVYFAVYLGVTMGHSRRRELLADRAAALAYGGDAFGAALNRAIRNGELFDRSAVSTLIMLRQTGRPCQNLYRCLDAADTMTPGSLRELRTTELVQREEGKYDSHPPPHERIARVAGIPAHRPVDEEPALTLFEAPEKLAEELTGEFAHKVEDYLTQRGAELPPVRGEVVPALQEQFAGAVAFHRDALDMRERAHPEADTALVASARKLEETVGADDPFIVPVLQEMAYAQHRMGDTPAAQASLQRAIGILEALPVKDQGEIDALKQQLNNVSSKAA